MEVQIVEVEYQQKVAALIEKAVSKDMPLKKDGWNFTWKNLYKTEGGHFFQLILKNDTSELQGILMLSVMYDEMLYMNNIEVAPQNVGSTGKYDAVAACLIAYACLKSFELGKNIYKGYLTFESKTKLIPLYQNRYGATLAMGQRMFIEPKEGLKLMDKYLKI